MLHGGVAQLVEQVNHNHLAGGSSPSAATFKINALWYFIQQDLYLSQQ